MIAELAPARPSLTGAEIAFARSVQVEGGFTKLCRLCGLTLPAGAFPGYGSASCTECQGLSPWTVG